MSNVIPFPVKLGPPRSALQLARKRDLGTVVELPSRDRKRMKAAELAKVTP